MKEKNQQSTKRRLKQTYLKIIFTKMRFVGERKDDKSYFNTNLVLKIQQIVSIFCSRLESLEQSDAKASCVEG